MFNTNFNSISTISWYEQILCIRHTEDNKKQKTHVYKTIGTYVQIKETSKGQSHTFRMHAIQVEKKNDDVTA